MNTQQMKYDVEIDFILYIKIKKNTKLRSGFDHFYNFNIMLSICVVKTLQKSH